MKYELCYLVGESKEQELPRIKEEVAKIVSNEGGKWLEPQIEEKRKMAYKVEKEIRGIYVTAQFEIIKDELEEGEVKNPIESINRKMNLYNDILRFILIRADGLPELKVREIKEAAKKDFRKPVYMKKSEPVVAKAPVEKPVVEEKKAEETEVKEAAPVEAVSKEEKAEDKSIDEKIDEILNI